MNVEEEARKRALEHVAKLVQRPDQLDRIGEMKKKSERKKVSIKASKINRIRLEQRPYFAPYLE